MSSQRPSSTALAALRRKRIALWSIATTAFALLGVSAVDLLTSPTDALLLMSLAGWETTSFENNAVELPALPPGSDALGRVAAETAFAPADLRDEIDDRADDAVTVAPGATDDEEIRWFNGRPIRPVKTMRMLVTAYSPDERSCGIHADGITASGYSVWTNGMKLVAADTSILPFGSLVSVPGYDGDEVVPVLDRGGKIKGHRLDVLYPSHEEALQWGAQRLEVVVWEYADGEPDDFRTSHRRR